MTAGFRAVLLAGGRGSRLASVFPGLPKVLVPIGGIPLLALQLSRLRRDGCLQVVVVVSGYGVDFMRNVLKTCFSPPEVVLVEEVSGTLGAALAGLAAIESSSEPIVVLNGDTVVDVDLALCADLFPAWARVTAVLTELPTGQNEGRVLVVPTGHVRAFEEVDAGDGNGSASPLGPSKQRFSELDCLRLSNCGVYIVDRSRVLFDGPTLRVLGSSWERHALVHYRRRELLAGITPLVHYVLDVGTPERYEQACREASVIHRICGYERDEDASHVRLA